MRIEEWNTIWTDHVRPNLWPGRLRLNLVCDANDLETASLLIEPFLTVLQPDQALLADLSIRISKQRDHTMSTLAHRAVSLNTTGRDYIEEDAASFRFMELPVELRLHVLSFTDVVAPRQEVEWNPFTGGFYIRYNDRYYHPEHDYTMKDAPHMPCWDRTYPYGCFCRAQHSAYSSEYPCLCWTRPQALFLVSRTFCTDALRVFYSENRFVVNANGSPWHDADAVDCLPASIFLTSAVPESCLKYLRNLDFVFPSLGKINSYCTPQTPAWENWVRTLDYVKDKLHLSNINLRVTFAKWHPGSFAGHMTFEEEVPEYRQGRGEREFQLARQSYLDTIAPLQRLRGLKRFFVYLADPYDFSRAHYDDMAGPIDYDLLEQDARKREQEMQKLNARMERMIMGDDYDANLASKAEMPKALWLYALDRFWCEL